MKEYTVSPCVPERKAPAPQGTGERQVEIGGDDPFLDELLNFCGRMEHDFEDLDEPDGGCSDHKIDNARRLIFDPRCQKCELSLLLMKILMNIPNHEGQRNMENNTATVTEQSAIPDTEPGRSIALKVKGPWTAENLGIITHPTGIPALHYTFARVGGISVKITNKDAQKVADVANFIERCFRTRPIKPTALQIPGKARTPLSNPSESTEAKPTDGAQGGKE